MMRKLGIAAVAVLVAVHLTIWTVTLLVSPVGFDEAFILQAPLNLVQGMGYSTEDWLAGGSNLQFDATVSTGPVLGIPVAASFAIFGVSITAARLVTLPFFLLLIWGLIVLGRRYAGWWGSAAALGMLLVVDTRTDLPYSVIYGPSDVLGEYTTAALLVLAFVILPRHRLLAGLAVGFAILCKFIAVIAVPGVVIAMLLVPAVTGARWAARIGEAAAFVGFVAIPSVVWELVKLVSLGPSAYLDSLWSYLRFVFRSGSGADGTNSGAYLDRASRLFATWQFPTVVAFAIGLVVIVLCVVGIWRRSVDRGFAATPELRWRARASGFLGGVGVEIAAVVVTLGGVALWWTFVSSSVYTRHMLPILLATVPVVAALAVHGLRWVSGRNRGWQIASALAAGAAVVTTGYGGVQSIVASTQSPGWTRSDQQATADFVRSLDVPAVQGIGWWEAPDIRFLSGVVSRPIGTTASGGPLVIGPMMEIHDPRTHGIALSLCEQRLFERGGFIVCEVDPDAAPIPTGA